MYNSSPQAGLAALTASPYADSDVMNVQMTPREVAGLQQLAMSYGANEQDLYDPVTGQPRFSFLKKILPMIAGAILPGVPVLGDIAKTIGFGNQALGSALLVGGVTGLVEGDLKKGLMAGLGAYSGAKIGEAFTAAGTPAPAPTAPTTEVAAPAKLPGVPSMKDTIMGGPTPRTFDTTGAATWSAGQPGQVPVTQAVQAATTVKPPPTGFFDTMGQGVKNVFASGETGDASRKAFGDVFSNPISRYATMFGIASALTPDQEPLNVPEQENIMYIPGGFNPQYGTGANQPYMLPGQYYKRTAKGLVPYNPYQKAPGYATGGPVQPADQNLNQQRALPHQYQPIPNPNQNYPLSTVVQANYQPNVPQQREVISGYEAKIDPYTGEEKFAEGGGVDDKEKTQPDPNNPGATANPFAAGAAGILPGATKAGDVFQATTQQTGTAQKTAVDPNVEANRKYVEELNRRALNPTFTPYGMITGGGLGGTNTPWTGTNPYGGALNTTTGGQTTTGGGDSAAQTAAFLATQIGINWMMQPGNALALKNWITGGMKWAERPFLNADKAGTGTGTGTNTGTGQTGQTGGQQTQTGGETGGQQTQTGGETGGQQTTTGAEKPPVFDPVKGIVIAGGTSAAAIAAAKALAASKGVVTVTLLDGTVVAGGAAGAATGAAGAATGAAGTGAATTGGATAAGGAGAGGGGAAAGGAGGAGTTGGIGGAGFPGGAAGAGLAALLGAQQAYKGISQGKEGQAALGGALAGAGTAAFLGGTAPAVLGGANLATLAGFGPVGLAAAALAAIGASLVNTKEYGDVALRNYWNAVDAGRGIGQTDANELAQGFINFYRTNKNEFAGQAKYGRTGNEDFLYDMTQVINNAVKDGTIDKDVDAATMYKSVVQPWLNSMGEGPKDEKARAIQDFMMTDLINNFMQGKNISNAQVKGDKKYKIVSERPVYAGMSATPEQTPVGQRGIPPVRNPFAEGREYIPRGGEEQFLAEGGAIGEDYNFGFAGGGMSEYKAGGKLLNGPGDGMSDSIPAVIRGKGVQRAALADGEFVVPADVVSHLGNGSTKAGAKKLYAMMDRVRQARTGRTRQAPAVKTDRLLPA